MAGESMLIRQLIQFNFFKIDFYPQFDWLVYDLSISETSRLFARLKGVKASEIPEMCQNMMKIFGLKMYKNRTVQKLSGGNKREVSAASAFMPNPALVFLDEPTARLAGENEDFSFD